MKKVFEHIVFSVVVLVLLLCFALPVTAQDLDDGFYTSIYDRVKNEKQEKIVQSVAKRMGLSEKDIVAIAQGSSLDTIADIQALAIGGETTSEEIEVARDIILLKGSLKDAKERDDKERIEKLTKDIAGLEAQLEPLWARSKEAVPDILANYERLVSQFAFEESLVDLQITLEEETKA